MESGALNTLLFLGVAIAVVLVIQSIILLSFVLAFRKWASRMTALAEEVSRNTEPVLRAARELLADSKEKLNLVSASLVEISQISKNQITRLDGLLTETTDRARLQVIRLDQLVTDTIGRVEETTELVQRNLLTPIREISALLSGFRAALDYLFRRGSKTGVERATQDEELFI